MGIFGDIGDFIGGIASGPLGRAAGQILVERATRRSSGPPAPGPVFFPGGAGSPIGAPLVRAGFNEFSGPFGPPGVVPAFNPLQSPGPIDFGLDPSPTSFFRATKASMRPVRFLTQANPVTGDIGFWEHAGQPVLFSRDLRVCKRVGRIAARSRRSMGRVTRRRKR